MIDLTQPKYRGYNKNVVEFLCESNAIEGVYDEDSLDQALYAWKYLSGEKKLDYGVLLKTHKVLMLHQKLYPNEKGYFRQIQVYIGGNEALHFSQIRVALYGWLKLVNDELCLRDWQSLHVMYEGIHPFVDGNGRTGRMFMNWQRQRFGLPILVIKEVEKQDYYKWFE